VIFTFEAICKIITYGLWECGSKSYFRSSWNTLDFFVVVITLISEVIDKSENDLNLIKIFRLIKVIRPLRALSKNEGLKISINALRVALPEIIQISILSLGFYFIFGVIGVNYFKG
jgi:Ion transport protein